MREGLCGDPDARVDVQHEHVESIPVPECMKEGAIEQTCAVSFSSANAGFLNEESRCRSERSFEGLPTAISRSFMREGLSGAPDTRADVQHEHEETIP